MITWFAGLPTPYFAPVLNALAADRELDMRVIYLRGGSDGRDWGELELMHHHTYETDGGLHGFAAGFRQAAASEAVVVFGYLTFYSAGILLGAKLRRRQVFTQSDTNILDHAARPFTIRALKRLYLRLVYPRSTRVWTVSEENRAFWRLQGLLNQVRVSFESPVPQAASDQASAVALRSSLRLADNVVLYVGRLAPEKRVQDAIRAVRTLRNSGLDFSLVLVGSGNEDLLDRANETWVEFIGPVDHDQLAKYFLMADALVLPSDREPYGLVVREALQFGLPVVATDRVASALELCDKGWNVVPPREPALLAKALATACSGGRWPPVAVIDVANVYRTELLAGKRARGTA